MPRLKMVDPVQTLFNYQGYYWETNFPSIDGFTQTKSTASSFSLDGERLAMQTGAVINNYIRLEKKPQSLPVTLSWTKKREFKVKVKFLYYLYADIYVVMGDYTNSYVGFHISNGAVIGEASDVATLLQTSTLKTLTGSPNVTLKAVLNPSSKQVAFYVDDSLAATLDISTLSLDDSFARWLMDIYVQTTNADYKTISLSNWKFLQMP
jgi:hypothetical protein